jgi:hypothetical protein
VSIVQRVETAHVSKANAKRKSPGGRYEAKGAGKDQIESYELRVGYQKFSTLNLQLFFF